MKLSINVIKTSVYNGNLTYTTNLINALAQFFPENQYILFTQLNKKKRGPRQFNQKQYIAIPQHSGK